MILPIPRPQISHVVFDFDGTLSWLRHGWPEFMCDVFMENVQRHPGETIDSMRSFLIDEIIALNGKPSVFQCQRFVEILVDRGGPRLEAEALRAEFQLRLDEAIRQRMHAIRSGGQAASDYLIYGALPFLEHVRARGLTPVILSSTVQERVREEAELLGIHHFFAHHIYGGVGDPLLFSKRAIFEQLLAGEGITGAQLLSFGDGPVELRDTKELGGIAVAICSDENNNGSGLIDPHKEKHLLAVGADAALPDYRDAAALLDHILGR
ncbi:MAG TPA: HAD family hydrolase [Chthoniobacteraceae bacterium]|nr:HAD family hydrolase [Chthoniobacteraceae bacterium]